MPPLNMLATTNAKPAPPWSIASWLNTSEPPNLEALRGRVIVLHAFQMLCPGCVSHGIPQAQRIHALFDPDDVRVLGIHTVFEHHDAMRPVSLAAFLHEYRISFPVGIDEPGVGTPIPKTMATYQLRGTPSLVLIDRQGRVRLHAFGRPDDMAVGAAISQLVSERAVAHDPTSIGAVSPNGRGATAATSKSPTCDNDGCAIP